MARLSDLKALLLTDVRELFRRPTPEVLKNKERVLANLRATRQRAERLARLLNYEEWGTFMDVIDEHIEAIDATLRTIHTRKFLAEAEQNNRTMLLERKECYERIRGMAADANDRLKPLEDEIAEHQDSVNEYRERLGA